MEAKMENITISEKPLSNQTHSSFEEEENILAYIQGRGKKVELNVNAKEFVPRLSTETSQNSDGLETDAEQTSTPRTVLSYKNGDENYKPIFMNGMTEKFIQGPYMGNGRDPEIPYLRYFSNGQAIDFFNKKYFVNNNSGDITFKPYDNSEQSQDSSYTGPLFNNGFGDNNIFKPPFVNALVSDILYRQYLSALWPKSPLYYPPRRSSGKNPGNNFMPGSQRGYNRMYKGDRGIGKVPSSNGSNEEWFLEEDNSLETNKENLSEFQSDLKSFHSLSTKSTDSDSSANLDKDGINNLSQKEVINGDAPNGLKIDQNNKSPGKNNISETFKHFEKEILEINGCFTLDKSKELLTENHSPFLEAIIRREGIKPEDENQDLNNKNSINGDVSDTSQVNSNGSTEQTRLDPDKDQTSEDTFFQDNTTHS